MITTQVQGKKVKVFSKYFIVESNHGNHSGFNRTWRIWNEILHTRSEARRKMADHLNELNMAKPRERGYTNYSSDRGDHDLRYFRVLHYTQLADTFNGCGNDITSQPLTEEVF